MEFYVDEDSTLGVYKALETRCSLSLHTPPDMDPFAVLDQLVSIISSGVADIKRTYAAAGVAGPSLDQPWTANAVEQETMVQTTLVVAAASQLIRTLQPPGSIVIESMMGVSVLLEP
jgi:hypothetical protein